VTKGEGNFSISSGIKCFGSCAKTSFIAHVDLDGEQAVCACNGEDHCGRAGFSLIAFIRDFGTLEETIAASASARRESRLEMNANG
jgi:hypothetical protein